MLIAFVIRNFRSIHGEQRFDFVTSSDSHFAATHCLYTGLKSVPRLLKSAVIFGPNGGGKTTLLASLSVMRDLVLHSTTFNGTELAARYTPFLLDGSARIPTEFEVDLVLGGIRYRYGLSYDDRRICMERLLVYEHDKAQRWFARAVTDSGDGENTNWRPFSGSFHGPRAMWRSATRPQALFLTTAAQLNAAQLHPLYHWFETGLSLVSASQTANLSSMAMWIQDDSRKERLLDFLHAADIHVDDVRVTEDKKRLTHQTSALPSFPLRRGDDANGVIEFARRNDDGSAVWLRSTAESAGLRRLVSLFMPLTAALQAEQLLLIDEFDSSLHPLLARYLIELINDPQVSSRGAQLLLTSQNSSLMDTGILRRDEIWLMDLDEHQASRLVRLWKTHRAPRKGELIGKQYLIGRYGAVPEITSVDRLKITNH